MSIRSLWPPIRGTMPRRSDPLPKRHIHEAKTHLSRLLEEAADGEPFIIAKAGKPLVKVTRIDEPEPRKPRRPGFLAGRFAVPDDFDQMGAEEIRRLFEGEDESSCCWIPTCWFGLLLVRIACPGSPSI